MGGGDPSLGGLTPWWGWGLTCGGGVTHVWGGDPSLGGVGDPWLGGDPWCVLGGA